MMEDAFKKNVNLSIDAYKTTPYGKPYERYEFVYGKMKPFLDRNPSATILDIGCGDSSFLWLLRKRHPDLKLTGVEISQDLIDKARNEPVLGDVELVLGDAQDFSLGKKFDAVLMLGVLSIFDDIDLIVERMLAHLKRGGRGFIFGGFTEADIDVKIRYRNNAVGSDVWESGLNMFSLKSVERALGEIDGFSTDRFQLSMELPRGEDPIRTFTVRRADGTNLVMNGANIVRDFWLISFIKN